MYLCTINYSERGSRLRRDHQLIYQEALFTQGFLHFNHFNQNDARAITHQCLKGSYIEPILR